MFGRSKKSEKTDSKEWKAIKDVVDAQYRATNVEREKMTRYLRQWQGDIWDDQAIKQSNLEYDYKSRAHINLVFSTIEAIAPMLTDSRPITSVIPRQPYMEKLAWKYNEGLKYAWDTLDMQMEIYKLVLYGMIMKKGVLKIYYDPDKTFGGDLCVENIDPRDFGIAPGYTDIWKSPYCWIRSPKSLSWIRSHFPEAKDVTAETTIFDDRKKAYKYGEATDATLSASFATVYEVWMKDEETMEEVTKDYETYEKYEENGEEKERKVTKTKKEKQQKYPNGKFVYFTKEVYLGTTPCDYDHNLPPYVDFNDYVDPTSFLGIGEVDQIEGLNKEINLQFQAMMAHARRSNNPNYMVDIDQQIDPEELKDSFHIGGQHYSFSSSFGTKNPPIIPIEFANMNRDVYTILEMIPEAVKEVSGVRDISKGASGKKERQSASEIAILSESANTRTRQKVRNLEWTLKRVGYLLVRLMQQYYTEPRTIHTTDTENNINYTVIGNSLAQAIETIGPSAELRKKAEGTDNVRRDMEPAEADEYEKGMSDLAELFEVYDSENQLDPVLFDFEIVIQTNSTLPMDKQSLANLMLRLFQMKAVDAEAVLEILQIPGKEKILDRINKQRQAAMQAKMGRPQGGR
jgi:hypothetical protein